MTTVVAGHKDVVRLIEDLGGDPAIGPASAILYGSAARGDYIEKTSDLNLILVLEDLSPARLDAVAPAVRHWMKRGHPAPRLFSPALIRASADVFPIEFLDIREAHVVLHGRDPFAGLEIRPDHLRLQCEREIKEKLMLLREGYVAVQGEAGAVRRLLVSSYPAFAALFRGCLRLLGAAVPARNAEVIGAFCARAGLETAPFVAVERLRAGEAAGDDIKELFARYYAQVVRAAEAVDRFVPAAGGNQR
jgi:predicted nucleotidyltransferase